MRVAAAILAGGKSIRLGLDKTLEILGDRPVWKWSFDTYSAHPEIDSVVMVVSDSNLDAIKPFAGRVVLGGTTREESAKAALAEVSDCEVLLFHDAARPFVDSATISRTLSAINESGAAAACVPVKDTIRYVGTAKSTTLDRSSLIAMQTPQGARTQLLRQAFQGSDGTATDDIALLERMGIRCEFVQGSDANFKITTVEDLYSARLKVESKMTPSLLPRVGSGYDVHRFSDDAERPLMLGGVRFEGARALDGHSDADALLHAITDAVLGAACLGDIGMHFSNEDPRWKNAPSRIFLEEATKMVREMGYQIGNIDATVIAEEPKVMRRSVEIREAISAAAGVCSSNVSVKATTNERMGFIGRSEGIAAFATVMLVPWQ